MLQDTLRAERFRQAIFSSVKRGQTVIDLGTGTGILAIWAAQAGASRVYAIEETDTAEIAREVVARNGFDKIVTVLQANSSEVSLPEPADVLIAELVGHFFFEEGIVEYVADIRDKLLKPGAAIIPSAAQIYIAPVQLRDSFCEISFWDQWLGLDLSPVRRWATNSAYVESVSAEAVLADPCEIFKLNASEWRSTARSGRAEFKISRDGRLDAIAGWFDMELSHGVRLNTGPLHPITHWQQCVFPLATPVPVAANERVCCSFEIEPFGPGCKWRWELQTMDGKFSGERHEFKITYGQDTRLMVERF